MTHTHVGHGALNWRRTRNTHRDPRLNSDHALNATGFYVYTALCGRVIHADPDDGEYGEWTGAEVRKGTEGVTCAACQKAMKSEAA